MSDSAENNLGETEILLVEDNPDDLAMTLRTLRQAHLTNQIQVARDGVEALDYLFCEGEHASRQTVGTSDLILLDLKLPRIDGLEVLKRVKTDPRTRGIPVVVLTSSQEESDIVNSYHLGVNSYIVKPVNFQDFAEAVRNLGVYWLLLNQRAKAKRQ